MFIYRGCCMWWLVMVVTTVLVLPQGGQTLYCIDCQTCDQEIGVISRCNESDPACMKVVTISGEFKQCANKLDCGLGDSQRLANTLLNFVYQRFSDTDLR
ncbi:uncharacterized protein [Cherax quadricarinatus]|uniref:uncharacterized protein isoform X2 n=1 Tax=Cherax quadricarinatus TaxID=27406 RepID=UPI00387EC269